MSEKLSNLVALGIITPDDLIYLVDSTGLLSRRGNAGQIGGPSVLLESRAVLFWEWVEGEDAAFWDDQNSTGTGTVNALATGDAEADEGLGILNIDSGAGIGLARYESGSSGTPRLVFRGSLATVAELRVKLPATPNDINFNWGFDDSAGSSCKMKYDDGVGTWDTTAESQAGTGSDAEATAVAALAGWNTLRIEWDPGAEARFYVNDTLVSTLSTANAIPQGNDEMSVYIECDTLSGKPGRVLSDWVRIAVNRA